MPLPVLHQAMSFAEFENSPHLLGWKHEYYSGERHLSPSKVAIVTLRLAVTPVPLVPLVTRPPEPSDAPRLIELFLDSFADAVEYAGWPSVARRRSATESITTFFADVTSAPALSAVALDGEQIIAAAFIRYDDGRPQLRPMFVQANRRRQGVGRALFAEVRQRLHTAGVETLWSKCHLGNTASLTWHAQQGFVEVPDQVVAQSRCYHHHWEAERFRRRGETELADRHARLAEIFDQQCKELEVEWYDNLCRERAAGK